jgi:acyl-CoA dehydrogenase
VRDLIEDGIRRILQDHVTPQLLDAARRGEWNAELWELLETSGFTRALCSSGNSGSDASWSDVLPLLLASGYHCLPLPLPETLLASSLLENAGIEPPVGPIGLVDGQWQGKATLEKTSHGWRVQGELTQVPFGRHCGHLVAQMALTDSTHIVLLPTDGLELRPDLNLAREPRDTFIARNAVPLAVTVSPDGGEDVIRPYGALLRAAQTAGAGHRALEQAVQYATDRVQFGRPLAKFQAVQQQIALAVSELAAVTAAAEHACGQAGSAGANSAVAVAKITAAEAAGVIAAVAHAVHGAMGYTAEHPLHHATQRLWSWRSEFGNLNWWSQRLGGAICAQGAGDAWHAIIDARLPVTVELQGQA